MKSQTTSVTRAASGFLIVEAMLAFSIMTLCVTSLFVLSASLQRLKAWSINTLHEFQETAVRTLTLEGFEEILYGNDTKKFFTNGISILHSDYEAAWGRDSCFPRLDAVDEDTELELHAAGIDIGIGNPSTDLEVRHGFVYLASDSSTASQHDFFIIDSRDNNHPSLVSSLNTGPGIFALEVAGPYAFLAQSSSAFQLQVIDIYDRDNPVRTSQLKVPVPTPTTTAPFGVSIFYADERIYLGTEKWNGPEFFIIDVSDPLVPTVIGSFETGTMVRDVYVRDKIAYLASSGEMQMRMLDVSNPSNPTLIDFISPSGWQTQDGRIIEYFEDILSFGRTTGGFNSVANHEAFIASSSRDIPGGVYGMLLRPPFAYLATHSSGHEFQIWNSALTEKILDAGLGFFPEKMTCDEKSIFFATGTSRGFASLTFKNK